MASLPSYKNRDEHLTRGGGDTKCSGGYSAQKLFNISSVKSAIGVNCHSGCPGFQNVAMTLVLCGFMYVSEEVSK